MTSLSLAVTLVTLLAVLRLTRLVIHDSITQPFRDFLDSRESRFGQWLSELFSCPWCIGFWFSLTGAAIETCVANPFPHLSLLWTIPALALALSYLVGFGYTIAYTIELYDPPQHQH